MIDKKQYKIMIDKKYINFFLSFHKNFHSQNKFEFCKINLSIPKFLTAFIKSKRYRA